MKKSELIQIIKEEISKTLSENPDVAQLATQTSNSVKSYAENPPQASAEEAKKAIIDAIVKFAKSPQGKSDAKSRGIEPKALARELYKGAIKAIEEKKIEAGNIGTLGNQVGIYAKKASAEAVKSQAKAQSSDPTTSAKIENGAYKTSVNYDDLHAGMGSLRKKAQTQKQFAAMKQAATKALGKPVKHIRAKDGKLAFIPTK